MSSNNIITSLFYTYLVNEYKIENNVIFNDFIINYFIDEPSQIYIVYEELFTNEILINDYGTNKYLLNPVFKLDDNKYIENFYNFLAKLIYFFIVNNYGLEKKLYTSLLILYISKLTNKNIYISDYPLIYKYFYKGIYK